MSNLGWYQAMTTWAKKMGGPLKLLGIVAVGGYVVIRSVEAGGKTIFKIVKKNLNSKGKTINDTYLVNKTCKSDEGVLFEVGDQFQVLEIADDAVLIEKIGDVNNPYFVSADFLQSISDFKC